jgi:hypothetical protein
VWHATELALIEMVLARVWPLVERARSERAVAAAEAKIRQTLAERRAELERLVAERTARLQDTVAELESFSYSISHDLRAPLRAMTGFGELLAEEYGDRIGPEGRDYLRRIITASRRMDRLTQDVLVYSRVSRTELPLVPVDLEALVTGIVESYPQFHEELADVIVRGPFPRVLGNEAALMQCVSNLMSNAVKFVAPGVRPRVEVSTTASAFRPRRAEKFSASSNAFITATRAPASASPWCGGRWSAWAARSISVPNPAKAVDSASNSRSPHDLVLHSPPRSRALRGERRKRRLAHAGLLEARGARADLAHRR